ncbi:MAG: hypothetical protein JNM84_08840 [Planctomycetes bacterium]|nr:hypothetical protein [Planctomycetota bacterium]
MPLEHDEAHVPHGDASAETWITIAEAAQLSGRSPTQFYVWRSKGRAPVRIEEREGKVCVHADDLRRWTQANPKRESSGGAPRGPRPRRPEAAEQFAPAARPSPAQPSPARSSATPSSPTPPAPAQSSPAQPSPAAAEQSSREEQRPHQSTSSARSFSFRCETGAELRSWAELLDELGRRGVQLSFRIESGRITLS